MVASRRLAAAAESAEAQGLDRPDDILRAVSWRLDGGGKVDSPLLARAARRAYFAHDLRLAERLGRAAFNSGGGVPAGLLLAQILGTAERPEEQRDLLYQLGRQASTDEQAGMVVMCRHASLGAGQLVEAEDDLTHAGRRLLLGHCRDELIAQQAGVALLRGHLAKALMLAESILGAPDHGPAVVKAAFVAASGLLATGLYTQAHAVAEQGLAAQRTVGDQGVILSLGIGSGVLAVYGAALGGTGRMAEAEAILASEYDAALHSLDWPGMWCGWHRGAIALLTGRVVTAAHLFAEGAAVVSRLGLLEHRRWFLAGHAIATAQQGDLTATRAAIAELDTVPTDPVEIFELDVLRARAWYATIQGNLSSARALLRDAAHRAASMGAPAFEAAAWHDAVRFGAAAETVAPLARLAEIVEGDLVRASALHAAGAANNDAALLVSATDRFEAFGAVLFAADAAAAASAVYRRHEQSRLADSLSTRAHTLAMRCQGASTPALRLAGPAAVLTARERQVAGLAVQGPSSKAIAEQLTLSVRTVDSHLQQIYTKLGITGRAELRTALDGARTRPPRPVP